MIDWFTPRNERGIPGTHNPLMSKTYQSADALVDALIGALGKTIVLGLPVGIGKALHIADALYERAAADSSLSLTIFTGLTLTAPRGRNTLESRFIEPFAARHYAGWPMPQYAAAIERQELPDNIRVREFYLRPGAYLGNPLVQQNYTSINYSQVVDELLELGVNVIAQLIAVDRDKPGRYSLSSNPEITLDLLPEFAAMRQRGQAVAMVGQVSRNLPYMCGAAEIDAAQFDFVLDNEALDFPLFGLPNRRVTPADYATAMHVASLVADGGTLQLGIGSLSDAVAHCLRLRHESPKLFSALLALLPGGSKSSHRGTLPVEAGPFKQGLYASSELLSDALFSLLRCGILHRGAGGDDDALIHAGFFIGSKTFYDELRCLPAAERRRIRMAPISFVNTLHGDEQAKRQQRRHARFVNETMMATLLGAAVSDSLADGRVVSGVGGQFDFVSMAQALKGAHSILMLRARRLHNGVATSNIRWAYGNATVPRHHRDIFVSEYGIAATRGRSDRDVIEAMLNIADAEFQAELAAAAIKARKVPAGFRLAADARHNTPQVLDEIFGREEFRPHFPPYPLGTDFTDAEQELVVALEWLEERMATTTSKARTLIAALRNSKSAAADPAIVRIGLAEARKITDRLLRRLVAHALQQTRRQ